MSPTGKLLAQATEMLEGPMTLPKAMLIAVISHGNQEDKGGNTYVRHVFRVMEAQDTEDEMVPAVLHDTPEDTSTTLEDIEYFGATHSQLKIIGSLTKVFGPDFNHDKYIENIRKSVVATKIKIQDMKDNMKLWRLKRKTLTKKDMDRFQKYIWDLDKLGGLNGKED